MDTPTVKKLLEDLLDLNLKVFNSLPVWDDIKNAHLDLEKQRMLIRLNLRELNAS